MASDADNAIFRQCRDIYQRANPTLGQPPQDVTLPAELFDAYEAALQRTYDRIPYGGIDLERGEYLLLKGVRAFRAR